MTLAEHADILGPELLSAIERKGYNELTAVQLAVLDPALEGRDLRITSQTGSGKTLAIGFTLRGLAGQEAAARSGVARPRALVVAPTRELAQQVEQELTWLYAQSGSRIASATGGTSYRDEHRALSKGPSIVVATPGRLLDHLNRGSIDPSQVGAVVLDEADRMLDLGFREELVAIFKSVPENRRTHLVSATFPRMVRALADSVQRDPAHVQGTRLGVANVDIDHVIHIVDPSQRLDALVNLLLANPEDQTLVFVRTRADAATIANELVVNGFAASGLSGEMDQAARNRALAAFKTGRLRVLIATDVAARGIDVQDVARVVHAELPTNPDAYTHRSGRTGRAGRKGTSSLLVAPSGVVRATRLLRGLGIQHRFEAIPTAEQINRAGDERILAELTGERAEAAGETAAEPEARWRELTGRLLSAGNIERTLARLLARTAANVTPARQVRVFGERTSRDQGGRQHEPRSFERPEYARGAREPRSPARPSRDDASGAREPRSPYGQRGPREQVERSERSGPPERERSGPRPAAQGGDSPAPGFTPFRVTWGRQSGADARRLLAVVCKRGQIRGRDVGAIRVDSIFSIVEVANEVASDFARAAEAPDTREPSIVIRREGSSESSDVPARSTKPRATYVPPKSRAHREGDQALKRRPPAKARG